MSEDAQDKTPEEIRQDIEQTRENLGDTVEALSAKTDVKAQAGAKVSEIRQGVRERAEHIRDKASDAAPGDAQHVGGAALEKVRANPVPVGVVSALAVGFFLGRWSAR